MYIQENHVTSKC